jgi:glycerate kinase
LKVLIIPDSFKGSLKATEVALEMEKAVSEVFPNALSTLMPFSDGGEGALTVLENHADGKIINCTTTDSLKRNLIAPFFLFENSKSAWIELSQTAGLVQLNPEERNPLKTSTWGTGVMIRRAMDLGCKTIFLGIGGSATHDLGTGIISALGGKFYDVNNTSLEPNGAQLKEIDRIDLSGLDSRVKEIKWVIACDVKNSLTGPYGAANTYAKQKGATPEVILALEKGSKQFAKVIKEQFDKNILDIPGGGAAGGVSAGLFGVFDATLQNGFELLSQQTKITEQIKEMDLVLTGEGHFDEQSTYGKLALQVAKLTKQYKIKTLVFAGKTSLSSLPKLPHLEIHQTTPPSMSLEKAMKNAAQNLRSKLLETLNTYKKQIH